VVNQPKMLPIRCFTCNKTLRMDAYESLDNYPRYCCRQIIVSTTLAYTHDPTQM
jgi:DNA-directed RNA polymerase subunit N (RpoN/RPB10)